MSDSKTVDGKENNDKDTVRETASTMMKNFSTITDSKDVELGAKNQAEEAAPGSTAREGRERGAGGSPDPASPPSGSSPPTPGGPKMGSRRGTVARVLRRLTLAMILIGLLAALVTSLWIFMGPIFVVQLGLVAVVAYLAAGGRLRWVYVAVKTLPRDVRALTRYIRLLLTIKSHQKKNLSVADVFGRNVAKHPNKPCFVYEDREWTFQQVDDYSNKIAWIFKSHGYRKGDAVALLMENRPEFVAIWIGLSKLGIVVPLINTNLKKSSLLHSVNVANCQAMIYSAESSDAVKDIFPSLSANIALYRLSENAQSPFDGINEKALIPLLDDSPSSPIVAKERGEYSDKLLYIYTSGTTGLPKAAVITNSRYIFIASGIHYVAGFRYADKFYTPLPLYHTAGGIMAIGQALLHGTTVVIRKKFSASSYFADCAKYNCTIGQYIGEMCRYILATPRKPEDDKHNVRMIFGNGLRPQIWQEFVKRFKIPNVAEFYGATEGNANIVNIDNTVGAIGFVSRIIPSVYPISIIRVDANGEPIRNAKGLCTTCEPNEPGAFIGKIIPNNPSRAFLGYVDSKASESKVVYNVFARGDSAFISGDILIADEFGYLYFKDRTGDTFRWKGENVSTSEVEAVVSNLASYKDCVVYGVEIRGAEGRAGMAAIYDPDDSLNLEQLVLGMKDQLPAYARPQFVRSLRKIDLTGTFKLKKKDLQDEGYDPSRIQDKLYYLDSKSGYQPLTPDVYDQIQQGKIRL